jgi:hypothetical protein
MPSTRWSTPARLRLHVRCGLPGRGAPGGGTAGRFMFHEVGYQDSLPALSIRCRRRRSGVPLTATSSVTSSPPESTALAREMREAVRGEDVSRAAADLIAQRSGIVHGLDAEP